MNQQLTTRDSAMKNLSNPIGFLNEPRFQLEQVKTEKARRNLKAFMMRAWPALEPSSQFVEGIHIDAICLHLQAVMEGRIPLRWSVTFHRVLANRRRGGHLDIS